VLGNISKELGTRTDNTAGITRQKDKDLETFNVTINHKKMLFRKSEQ